MNARNTYKYKLRVDGEFVLAGITIDLHRRQLEHRVRWPTGVVERVGRRTTGRAAMAWLAEQKERGAVH